MAFDDDDFDDFVTPAAPKPRGGLDPQFESQVNEIIGAVGQRGLKARLSEGYRSPQRQDALYAQGRTQRGPVVTYARGNQGKHTRGRAADIDLIDAQGRPLPNNDPSWKILGEEASRRGLTWGGNFPKLKDFRHVEAGQQKPKPVDDDDFDQFVTPSEQSPPPARRNTPAISPAQATATPTKRHQLSYGEMRQQMEYGPPLSLADLRQADDRVLSEYRRGSRGLIPEGVDPRVLKGEQPLDRVAHMRASDAQTRLEPRRTQVTTDPRTAMGVRRPSLVERVKESIAPYTPGLASLDTPGGVKTDVLRGAASGLTLGAVGDRRQVSREEELLDPEAQTRANVAHGIGEAGTAVVPYAGAARVAGAVPALAGAGRAARAARIGTTFGGVSAAREGINALKTGEPISPADIAIDTAVGAAMGAIPGANPRLRTIVTAAVGPQLAADVARGVPVEQAAQNAVTNLLFAGYEIAGRRDSAAARREHVAQRLEGLKGEFGERQRERVSSTHPSVEAVEVTPESLPKEASSSTLVPNPVDAIENPNVLRATIEKPQQNAPVPTSADVKTAEPRKFYHRDYGEVIKAEDQSGAKRGRTKVYEADNPEKIHYIKDVQLTGAGNQRAVPFRHPVEKLINEYIEPKADPAVELEADLPQRVRDLSAQAEDAYIAIASTREGEPGYEQAITRHRQAVAEFQSAKEALDREWKARGVIKGSDLFQIADPELLKDFQRQGIKADDTLELRSVDLADIKESSGGSFVARAKSRKPLEPPITPGPIVLGRNMQIADGFHRTDAAYRRGDKTIEAWVPRESSDRIPTVPERPETIDAQFEALREGRREAVLIPEGTEATAPRGFAKEMTPEGPLYFNPDRVSRNQVRQQISDNTYGELLGHVEGKPAPGEPAAVVTAKEGDVEVQSSAVSPERAAEQARETQARHPDAEVRTGGPDLAQEVIAERLKPDRPTSVKNAATEELRRDLDLLELEGPEVKTWQQTIDNAKSRKLDEQAEQIAQEVIDKKRQLSEEDEAGIQLRMRELENRWEEVYRQDPKSPELTDIKQRLDNLTRASKEGGTPLARALAFRRSFVDKDYKLISVVQRAEKAAGRRLSEKEFQQFEQQTARVKELEAQLAKANEKSERETLQRDVDRLARRERRTETKQTLDDEFAQLKAQFAQARAETRNVQASGLAGLDPEGRLTRLIGQMVRNRIKAGVTDASQLVDDIHTAIAEHLPGVGKREIRDAISGYSIAPKTTRSELQKQVDALKSELHLLSKTEDIEAGTRSPHREGPKQSEARRLPMEGPRKSEERSSGIPRQGPKLSDVRKLPAEGPRLSEGQGRKQGPRIEDAPFVGPRQSDVRRLPAEGPRLSDARQVPLQGPRLSEGTGRKQGPRLAGAPLQGPRKSDANKLPALGPKMVEHGPPKRLFTRDQQRRRQIEKQIVEVERRLREHDYAKPPPRQKPAYTRETRKLEEEIQNLKNKLDLEIERHRPGHGWRNLAALRKSWMLSGLSTQAKNILGTGGYQAFDELARIPAVITDAAVAGVTKQRGISTSPTQALDGILQAYRVGGKEAKEILKRGATQEQLERHQFSEIDTGVKLIDFTGNIVFRFMSASDRVFYNYAYKRNLQDRATVQAKNEGAGRERAKELTDNPPEELDAAAKHDALVSTFNNNNRLSNAIKGARAQLGPKANFAIDLVMPFDRTPTNVIARILEASPAGFAKAATGGYKQSPLKVAKSIIDKTMTVEEQRQFSQTIGRATAGSAIIGLGWALGDALFDVEKYKVYIKIPGLGRFDLTSVSPLGNMLALGARYRKNYEEGKPWEAVKATTRIPLDQPLLQAGSNLADVVKDPERSLTRQAARTASSFIPLGGAMRDVAKVLDPEEKRKARGFTEQVQQGIPVWRQSLPVDVDKKQQREVRTESVRQGSLSPFDLEMMVESGEITEAQRKQILRESKMEASQARFNAIAPATALERYERMDAAQRQEVEEVMSRKAYSLLNSDSLTDEQKEAFRARIEALGITPQAPKRNTGNRATRGFQSTFK